MIIIKNRITGEYDRKGMHSSPSKIQNSAWANIGAAKLHACNVLTADFCGIDHTMFAWYMNADFIELTEEGVIGRSSVKDYLAQYFSEAWQKCYLTPDEQRTLWGESVNGG